MKTYTITVQLLSETLIGSGEGFGAIIDSDVVFDDLGIPYIPAKRIKGCLRDSTQELCAMLEGSQIKNYLDLTKEPKDKDEFKIVADTFGRSGQQESAPVYFSNLTIEEYEENRKWLEYLSTKYKEILSTDSILATFTGLRQQTKIDEGSGVADEHSLRTIRVLNKGLTFTAEIQVKDNSLVKLLALACLNFRRIGTKRNRGFGEIECKLLDGTSEITILKELEEICSN